MDRFKDDARDLTGRNVMTFLLLAALAVGGNLFKVSLFFGVDFLFGSIAALVAVQILGLWSGVAIGLIGGGVTFFLWGHPYAMLIFTLEALCVGLLMKRLPDNLKYLALSDMIYWMVLGGPLVKFFYGHVMGMALPQAGMIALKQPVNGVLNALLAAVVVIVIGYFRRSRRISIGNVIFNALAGTMFITAVVLTSIYAGPMKKNAEVGLEQQLVTIAQFAVSGNERIQDHLPTDVRVKKVDAVPENLLPVTGQLQVHLPPAKGPLMKRWRRAEYVVRLPLDETVGSTGWVVVTKSAVAVIDALHTTSIRAFALLAAFAVVALIGALTVTRLLIHPLQNLVGQSNNLPDRIAADRHVEVSGSFLAETDQLAVAFRGMAQRLRQSFGEVKQANEMLEKRVEERTVEFLRAKEAAEAASRAKSDFISSVSHELRTPLTAILGALKLVRGGVAGALPEKASSLVETSIRNGDRLLTLVNDVLDFSKFESGKMMLKKEPTDVTDLIGRVMESTQGLAGEKGLSLTHEIPPEIVIRADAQRIEQVFINLIGNAVKFTDAGSVQVSARALDREIEFCVADTGCGIHPDQLDDIFDAFTQVDASITRKTGGTGLGLAISKQIVELHGGRIWVESEPEAGSRFLWTIPLHVDLEQMSSNPLATSP